MRSIIIPQLFLKAITVLMVMLPSFSYSDVLSHEFPAEYRNRPVSGSIKTVNGKFYAYIVLLFNDNPHFVDIIQKGTISHRDIGIEGFNVKAYRNYISTVQDGKLREECELLLKVFLEPDQFSAGNLRQIENTLSKRNIILKFFREGNYKGAQISLDYCIYGEKVKIDIRHPLIETKEEMYYIKPYIYYDEFSTSNSTLYYDLIYINPEEVNNDYNIAKNIINGKDVRYMLFNGSKISDDIRQCLQMAFKDNSSIKSEIWKMFVVHELTHKYMNNQFNNYDQVSGEEISLSSTVYSNPYLGLSVMYSYLDYGKMNPHRIASMNFIHYLSEASGNKELVNNPGLVKNIQADKLKEYSKNHFHNCINRLKGGR